MWQQHIWSQLQIKEPLHETFYRGFAINFVISALIFSASWILSPLVWKDLDHDYRPLWHATVAAFFNPVIVGYSVWPEILRGWNSLGPRDPMNSSPLKFLTQIVSGNGQEPDVMNFVPTEAGFYATGLSCGFMFFDLLTMIVWAKSMRKVQKALYPQMVIHHAFSICFWPYALISHTAAAYVLYFVFTEITNPFLNLRWLLEHIKGWGSGITYYTVGVMLLVSFFIIRILPFPFFVSALLRPSSYEGASWFQAGVIVFTCPIPFFLNVFWFNLMMKKTVRVIKASIFGSKAKEAKSS